MCIRRDIQSCSQLLGLLWETMASNLPCICSWSNFQQKATGYWKSLRFWLSNRFRKSIHENYVTLTISYLCNIQLKTKFPTHQKDKEDLNKLMKQFRQTRQNKEKLWKVSSRVQSTTSNLAVPLMQ